MKGWFELGYAEACARGLTGRAARRYAIAFERRQLRLSPPPHAHPRDVPAVLAHEARGAVGDEEREPECDG